MNIGLPEVVVILVIVLVLFGAKRLPELARSIGRAALELRKGLREPTEEPKDAGKDDAENRTGG